jgi:hypothetical protein
MPSRCRAVGYVRLAAQGSPSISDRAEEQALALKHGTQSHYAPRASRARFTLIRHMRRLKKFVSVSASERRLLLQTVWVVGTIRAALWLFPFSTVQERATRASNKVRQSYPVGRVIWSVRAVSRCVPAATCLTQAMAAQFLLARSGHISRVQIGVAKDDSRGFEAHAWLVCGDEILLGGSIAERYVPLTTWGASN